MVDARWALVGWGLAWRASVSMIVAMMFGACVGESLGWQNVCAAISITGWTSSCVWGDGLSWVGALRTARMILAAWRGEIGCWRRMSNSELMRWYLTPLTDNAKGVVGPVSVSRSPRMLGSRLSKLRITESTSEVIPAKKLDRVGF